MAEKKDSEKLELLVAKIQKQLSPDAEVLHDVKLPGKLSGVDRQIDVLIRQYIGQYEILIIIDSKDHNKKVDVKGVEEFDGLIKDVGAHKGVLVCPVGFSETAKTRASGLQMDLYSPVDTDPHKWQANVKLPMLCDFRGAALSLGISHSAPMPFMMQPGFFHDMVVHNKERRELGTPIEVAVNKWNTGKYPIEPGQYERLPIFDEGGITVDNGYGTQTPINIFVSIDVQKEYFFGYLPIDHISGFKDELTGHVITNAFTTGIFNLEDVLSNWQIVECENNLPHPPVLKLRGLYGWDGEQIPRSFF